MRRSEIRQGFTLVEVLIVVVFLGIVATLMIPMMDRPTAEARRTMALRQLQTITNQIELYRSQHSGGFPTAHPTDPMGAESAKGGWGIMVSSEYLKEEPMNIFTESTRLGVGGVDVASVQGPGSAYGWYYEQTEAALTIFISGYDPSSLRFSNEEH